MNLTLILICLILVAVLVIFIVSSICRKLQAENCELSMELEQKNINMEYLVNHINEILKINSDKEKIAKEIRNAKDEKELIEIVNRAIVSSNNSKLRNKTKE